MLVASVLLAGLLLAGGAGAGAVVHGQVALEETVAGPALLQYQGLLLDPTSGSPKPDGTYQMIFSLYDVETGGTPANLLWSETRVVQVSGGLFSTVLGDQVALPLTAFDGRSLWLAVTVGADPEATPRQRLAHAAFAMWARNSDTLDGQQATAFARTVHAHSGADITTGTVAEPRIDPVLPRKADILTTVLGNDGAGSTLDADLLDGQQAAAFAAASHPHAAADITSGVLSTDRYSAYTDLVVDAKIGTAASQVAAGDHLHDSRYVQSTTADARYVNVAGDSMTGNLAVPAVTYTTPRLHVTSVSSEAFFPISNVDYVNGTGTGGAWKPAGDTGIMAASIQLPDGATVTKFRAYFLDNSTQNLLINLDYQYLAGSGYVTMASVTTASASTNTFTYLEDTTITYPVVDNVNNGYLIWVVPQTTWDGTSLMVKGVSIWYTLNEAP